MSPNLNPNCTPFIDAYKSTLLAKAALYNLPLPEEKISISTIHDTIKDHELEQIALAKRTIELQEPTANDNYLYLGSYEQHILQKAIDYRIPVMLNNLDITKLCLEVDDYEWLLDRAGDKLIDWDTSVYNPKGLEQAIAEADGNAEEEQRNYVLSIRSVYQYSRGV